MTKTVSGSLTAAGVSNELVLGNHDEKVTWAVSGTYSGHVLYVERAKASTLGSWNVIAGPYTTDDATLGDVFQGKAGDRFRFRVENVATGTDEVTGTIAYSLQDENLILAEFRDKDHGTTLRLRKDGVEIPGTLTVTGAVVASAGVNTSDGVGAANGTGVTAAESGNGVLQKTVLTLAAHEITVTDALAYVGSKLYDFPEGVTKVFSAVADLSFSVTSARAGTINADAAMDWALGSAAASNVTLASTMVDIIAKQDLTLDQADDGAHPDTAYDGTSVALDGTTTPAALHLNISFPTGTDIDADGTIEVTGTITILWANTGDY